MCQGDGDENQGLVGLPRKVRRARARAWGSIGAAVLRLLLFPLALLRILRRAFSVGVGAFGGVLGLLPRFLGVGLRLGCRLLPGSQVLRMQLNRSTVLFIHGRDEFCGFLHLSSILISFTISGIHATFQNISSLRTEDGLQFS